MGMRIGRRVAAGVMATVLAANPAVTPSGAVTACAVQLAKAASALGQASTPAVGQQYAQDCRQADSAVTSAVHEVVALWDAACGSLLGAVGRSGEKSGIGPALAALCGGATGVLPAPSLPGWLRSLLGAAGTRRASPPLPGWTPTFTLPVLLDGAPYTLRVEGAPEAYAAASGGSAPRPAAYLACAVLTPASCPLRAAVLASGDAAAPTALQEPAIEGALDWGYASTELAFGGPGTGCGILQQVAAGEPMQSLGVAAAQWADVATVVGPAIDTALNLAGGGAEAAQVGRALHLFVDVLHGPGALSAALPAGGAAAVEQQLVREGLAPAGATYDPAQLLGALAGRDADHPHAAAHLMSDLYSAAYGQALPASAAAVLGLYVSHVASALPVTAAGAAATAGLSFAQVWAGGPLTAQTAGGVAATAGLEALQGAALPLALDAAAGTILQGYVIPLATLLQTEVALEQEAQTLCASVLPLTQGPAADLAAAQADLGLRVVADGLLAAWFGADAQLNAGEERGAYTFAALSSALPGADAALFRRSAAEEAAQSAFDADSEPVVAVRAAVGTAALAQARLEASDLAAGRAFDPARHAPEVLAVEPPCGAAPSPPGLLATIVVGVNLAAVRRVDFGSQAAPRFSAEEGDLSLGASIPAVHGQVGVRVTGPAGTSALGLGDLFDAGSLACAEIATAGQPPSVSAVTPSQAPAGSTVTVAGVNLGGATAVRFGGRSAPFTVNADGTLTVRVPPGSGTVQVRVTTPQGQSGACWWVGIACSSAFTYAAPVLLALSPASGPAGTEVTLSGTGLAAATGIRFGSVLTRSFTVLPDGDVRVAAPFVRGTVQVQVLTPSGATGACLDVYLGCGSAYREP